MRVFVNKVLLIDIGTHPGCGRDRPPPCRKSVPRMPHDEEAERWRWERNAHLFESRLRPTSSCRSPPAAVAPNAREEYFAQLRRGPPASSSSSYDWKKGHDAWRAQIGLRPLGSDELRPAKKPQRLFLTLSPQSQRPLPPPKPKDVPQASWRTSDPVDLQPLLGPATVSGDSDTTCCVIPLLTCLVVTNTCLAFSAAYTPLAVGAAFLGSCFMIAALLLGPVMVLDDSEADPPPPSPLDTGEQMAPLATLLGSIKLRVLRCVQTLTSPMSSGFATALQISMGVSAIGQLRTMLSGHHPIGAAMIHVLCLAVQLPDSFAWLFVVPPIVAATAWLNDRRARAEAACIATAEARFTTTKGRLTGCVTTCLIPAMSLRLHGSKDQRREAPGMVQAWGSFFARAAVRRFNELGALVRHSPLKSNVILLNMIVLVNDIPPLSVPSLPPLPSAEGMISMPFNALLRTLPSPEGLPWAFEPPFNTSFAAPILSAIESAHARQNGEEESLPSLDDENVDDENGSANGGTNENGGQNEWFDSTAFGEDLLAAASVISTAAATSAFVRRRVRPDEFKKSVEREARYGAKEAVRAAALAKLRKCMQIEPLHEIPIDDLDDAIDAAQKVDVDPAQVELGLKRRELALQARQVHEREKEALMKTLMKHISTDPLKVDVPLFKYAIKRAEDLPLDLSTMRVASDHLKAAQEVRKRRDQALIRLDRASTEPDRRVQTVRLKMTLHVRPAARRYARQFVF